MTNKKDLIKKAYERQEKSQNIDNQIRLNNGHREIETLKLLANEVGFSLAPGMRLVDLGCADRFLEPACIFNNLLYTGLDYSDLDFEFNKLPFENCSVDIFISLAVIEHLQNPSIFISEIFRCLKPGGMIYISTPNFQLDWKNFYNDPTHVKPYTSVSLEKLLHFFGFQLIKTFPGVRCKPIHWYRGKYRFLKAFYLLPFRSDTKISIPNFLKGHARSLFAIGIKP